MGPRARAKAHIKHGGHVRDAGGVETQRLVERRRALPSGKGAYEEGETPLCVGEDPAADGRQGMRGERTKNM